MALATLAQSVINLQSCDIHYLSRQSKTLERAFKAAGLAEFSGKSLRHFLPSLLGNEGWSDTIIGKVLGHAPGSRCTKVYIHPYDSKLRDAMEVLDQAGESENRKAILK